MGKTARKIPWQKPAEKKEPPIGGSFFAVFSWKAYFEKPPIKTVALYRPIDRSWSAGDQTNRWDDRL